MIALVALWGPKRYINSSYLPSVTLRDFPTCTRFDCVNVLDAPRLPFARGAERGLEQFRVFISRTVGHDSYNLVILRCAGATHTI